MDISLFKQATNAINDSRTPLIIIPEQPSTDAIAGALALLLTLEKNDKNAKVLSPRFSLPPNHAFLPKSEAITHDLTSLRDFIIKVSLDRAKLDSLSYLIDDGQLHIHLTPKSGFFEDRDISTTTGNFAHDCIIVLDAPQLKNLGRLYTDNAEFFYHAPLLNIDHHPDNERYGQVNIVDVTANSVSEIIFELIRALGTELLDEQTATTLLTGIISKTKIFQSNTVTPRTLAIASHLVSAGAQRDSIINNLYQTKSVATLRLWGHALSRLQTSPNKKVVWTEITANDLRASRAAPDQASGVLDELMVNSPGAMWYILFIEEGRDVIVNILHAGDDALPRGLPVEIKTHTPQLSHGRIPGALKNVAAQILDRFN